MKRKANVRLTLNRETLRHLSDTETNAAQGGAVIGAVTQSCFQTYCVCVSQTCPTECGQWYCYRV
ncbi:MAG: class I lanthipeptide [Thermoanaerobaculia bacterium]